MKMCEFSRKDLSAFDFHERNESTDDGGLPAFGFPKYNHGWIECISTTFPGHTYYFNVETRCSTWDRPVPPYIPTPIAAPVTLMSDDDFLDNAPIDVSDDSDDRNYIEDEDYREDINTDLPPDADDVPPITVIRKDDKKSRDTKIYTEVLFKLYHGSNGDLNENPDADGNPFEREIPDDDSNDDFCAIPPETCYSTDNDDESTGLTSETRISRKRRISETSEDEESSDDIARNDGYRFAELDRFDLRRTNIAKIGRREIPSNSTVSSVRESCDSSRGIGGIFEEETSCESNNVDRHNRRTANKVLFSLPKLKVIGLADLTRPRKRRPRKKTKNRKASMENDEKIKKTSTKPYIKIVCNVNGVTTVNYDYLASEPPSGIKLSNLSDSGSSGWYDASYPPKNNKTDRNRSNENENKPKRFFDCPMNFGEPDLSDSSASRSSSVRSEKIKTTKIVGAPKV